MKARVLFAFVVSTLALTLSADATSIEGTVRSVDVDELRVVIVTTGDEIVAAYGSEGTPVLFGGSTYRIENLEVGDRVELTITGVGDDRRIDSIEVLESVSPAVRQAPRPEASSIPSAVLPAPDAGTTLTSVYGKVDQTRADRGLIRIIASGGMEWVRIDASNARTPDGTPVNVGELEFGETIEAIGSIGTNGELVATTIRRGGDAGSLAPSPSVIVPSDEAEVSTVAPAAPEASSSRPRWLDIVEFEGEIIRALEGTQKLIIRNDINGSEDVVWCDESLVALVDEEDPLPASDLEEGMRVEIRALRVSEGLVVQSINVND